jgi:hypothetical protein
MYADGRASFELEEIDYGFKTKSQIEEEEEKNDGDDYVNKTMTSNNKYLLIF